MDILVTLPDTSYKPIITELVKEEAFKLKISKFSLKTSSLEDIPHSSQFSGAIIQVFDKKGYQKSLGMIQQWVQPSNIPFIYIIRSSTDIDINAVNQFFPDQLLLFPSSEESLRNTIYLFLAKLNQGYFENDLESQRKRLWLSLKKGVYQSLDANEIKYIEAEDHLIKIHSEKQVFPLSKISLRGFYEKYLAGLGNFYTLNRSCVINAHKVRKIENRYLYIDPDKPLSIPKGKREGVLEFVGV